MERDITTITESYTLPSRGLIYNVPVNPTGQIRSMTTAEEMKRLSPTDRPFENLSSIIEDCLIEKPEISVYDMCLGDYQYLLQRMRVATYGPDYKFSVICPHCKKIYTQTMSLDDLKIVDFDGTISDEDQEVVLPRTGYKITLKPRTPRTMDSILDRLSKIKKDHPTAGDKTLMVTLAAAISKIDGKPANPATVETFVNRLPMADTQALIKKATEFNNLIGLDLNVDCKCPSCGNEFKTPFRDGPEFFGPEI